MLNEANTARVRLLMRLRDTTLSVVLSACLRRVPDPLGSGTAWARRPLLEGDRGGGEVVDLGAKLPDKIKFHFAGGVSGQSSSQVASGQSDYLVNQFCR